MSQSYTILDWDSAFFDCRIARFQPARTTHDELAIVVEACRQASIDCLYVLADTDHGETVAALEQHGFGLKDIRMTFACDRDSLPRHSLQPSASAALIRPVRAHEIERLESIARTSHTDTRFFFDRRISADRAAAMYQTWIRRSCEAAADLVLVAELDAFDGPIGYISCHLSNTAGSIGLVAVDEPGRGRGIGQQLVTAALSWFGSQNTSIVKVVTQGRNIPAQRLYQKANFRLESVQLWYHKWFTGFKQSEH